MEVKINLDQFEGPLDLLLHLITKKKINILDIPIAEITDQYNAVIHSWQQFDMETASDYILMAARLLQIKSKMMLPKPRIENDETDPRAELAAQLAQYSVFKSIGEFIGQRQLLAGGEFAKDPEYISGLESELPPKIELRLLERTMRTMTVNLLGLSEEKNEQIVLEAFTVEEKKAYISDRLSALNQVVFSELFGLFSGAEEIIVTLMAVLELYKVGALDFEQRDEDHEIILYERKDAVSAGAGTGNTESA